MERNFPSRGMKFPLQADPATGRFVLSSGAQNIRESIYIILMTSRGERWLLPEFGSALMSYTFTEPSATLLSMMKHDLCAAILEQEPRVTDVVVKIDPDSRPGCLLIQIAYEVLGETIGGSLAIPFYLNAASEEEAYEPMQ